MDNDHDVQQAVARGKPARMPPRWFVLLFWHAHRTVLRLSGGRFGLWRPKGNRWGALRLTTTGRRTGQPRRVVLGYFEDDGNLVTMAMNGWSAAEPAWWLNLQAHPDAIAQTRDGTRPVHARRAQGHERERLWSRWADIDRNLDAYAALRPRQTALVVLEPRPPSPPHSSAAGTRA
jgi:deazaflavin-dependent oxidoreductase (nitroreductase family)